MDMEHGIRESIYQIAEIVAGSVLHEQVEGQPALNVT